MATPPFAWRKLGRIFAPAGEHPWMRHFAQVPTPLLLPDRIRIFFTTRPDPEPDGSFVSVTTFLDVARDDPTRILRLHDRPVLGPGAVGAFDQFGAMPCSLRRVGDELWLYYVGWARARGVPWHSAVGLAVSHDDGLSFERRHRGPILTRTPDEPFVHGSPCVLDNASGDGRGLHLWYLSGTAWVESDVDGRVESIYRLMHARSTDGVHWQRDGREIVPPRSADECQARPAVLWHAGTAHLWFSWRHGVDFRNPQRGYGIGYAHSSDLQHWQRDDALAGLGRSVTGWDSEMVSYPSLLQLPAARGSGQQLLMFYCGNQMGRDGFGVAEVDLP